MQGQLTSGSVLISCALLAAQAAGQPSTRWIRQVGTNRSDFATAAAPDGSGGVFVAATTEGSFGGPLDGQYDAVLLRYDSAGHQVVLKQFGTGQYDLATAVVSDGQGGAFVAGYTAGGIGGFNAGGYDAFLTRHDGAGNPVWARQLGTAGLEYAFALAPAPDGGVFIAGGTDGSLGAPNFGGEDAFLVKYDAQGNQLWATQFGTDAQDQAATLAPDGAGGVFIAGFTDGSLGAPSFGLRDAFLARFDPEGGQVWVAQLGSPALDAIRALTPAPGGGVFAAGWTEGSLDGPNQGGSDIFVSRFDDAGGRQWLRQIGGDYGEQPHSLVPDNSGGVLVSGESYGSLGGTNEGYLDVVLAAYNGSGDQSWITQLGTSGYDVPYGMAVDGSGGFYIAGYTDGNFGGPNLGGFDAFLARFAAPCYPDCDASGALDLFDFLCFVNNFQLGGWVYADCDHSGSLDLFDFLCFISAFNQGCP